MPDLDDLMDAGPLLRRVAADVEVLNGPVTAASGPEVLSGGRLGASLDDFVAEARIRCAQIAAELLAAADEVEARVAALQEQVASLGVIDTIGDIASLR
jgi:hypothetical protein